MPWTAKAVEERLREAALVLLLMPDEDRIHRLGRPQAKWPDCARDAALAYGYRGDPGLIGKKGEPVTVTARPDGDSPEVRDVEVAIPKDKEIESARARAAEKLAAMGVEIKSMSAAIDRMDEALCWLTWLSVGRGRMVWRRLTGMPWWSIAAIEKRSDKTCYRWYWEAMEQIRDELITLERSR